MPPSAAATAEKIPADNPGAIRAHLNRFLEQGEHEMLLETAVAIIAALSGENRELSFRLQKALKQLYGRRSEKLTAAELQFALAGLFPQAPPAATAAATLSDWVRAASELLGPVAGAIHRRVMGAHVIQCDDTGLTVLDKSREKGSKRGHQWSLVGDRVWVSFHYTPTWEKEGPQRILKDRVGWLQADGYKGYEDLFAEGRCVEVGCWAHARRYFVDALQAGDPRAAVAVNWINELFALERLAGASGLEGDERKRFRAEQSAPVLDKLGTWAKAARPSAEPKSPLGQALTYLVNQWTALKRFLEDGALELSNNGCERSLRGIAIGRKNWLFAGSDAAAARAAIIYTVIGTAVLHGLDPWAYVKDLIEKIAQDWKQSRLDELLPGAWAKAHPDALRLTTG